MVAWVGSSGLKVKDFGFTPTKLINLLTYSLIQEEFNGIARVCIREFYYEGNVNWKGIYLKVEDEVWARV